jgi:hypothetical protein
LNLSIATLKKVITQETQLESPCCQQVCDEVEEDCSDDSLAPKYLIVETREGTKELTQPNLEDAEDVGREYRDHAVIVIF